MVSAVSSTRGLKVKCYPGTEERDADSGLEEAFKFEKWHESQTENRELPSTSKSVVSAHFSTGGRNLRALTLSCVLSHSSVSEVQWEAEFFSLQDNNNKLVAALHEANANVDQWKKQLAAYQEETETLRQRVSTGARAERCPGPCSPVGFRGCQQEMGWKSRMLHGPGRENMSRNKAM